MASAKLCPTVAPTLLFGVEVEVDPAPEPVPVGVALTEVVFAAAPSEVGAAPTVETPGGTVPPGQLVGGGALLDWTTYRKSRFSERLLMMSRRTYGVCVLPGRIGQASWLTVSIAES
jgi:hypothetical protein